MCLNNGENKETKIKIRKNIDSLDNTIGKFDQWMKIKDQTNIKKT